MKALSIIAVVALATGMAACGTRAAGRPAGLPGAVTATAVPAGSGIVAPAGIVSAVPRPAGTDSAWPSSPPSSLTGPATLTAADNGATVRLRVGQTVTVALAAEGMLSWDVPTAVGAAVRRVSASGGYPASEPARAAFLAVRPGEATLDTVTDAACLHAKPACEIAQREWRVTVLVVGS